MATDISLQHAESFWQTLHSLWHVQFCFTAT